MWTLIILWLPGCQTPQRQVLFQPMCLFACQAAQSPVQSDTTEALAQRQERFK